MKEDKTQAGQTVPLDSLVRCPDCIGGPLPGAIYDYSKGYSMERWATCPRCDGVGRIKANASMSGHHGPDKETT